LNVKHQFHPKLFTSPSLNNQFFSIPVKHTKLPASGAIDWLIKIEDISIANHNRNSLRQTTNPLLISPEDR
jgi:hypothetical protein